MALDFHLVIQENSRRWHAVQQIAREQDVTPEEAAEQVFDAGVRAQRSKSGRSPNLEVAELMPIFGLFADKPEFSEAIDQVIASRRERYAKYTA